MPGDPTSPRPSRLARAFPCALLGRGPRMALDGRKLILAALGLVLMQVGLRVAERAVEGRGGASVRHQPLMAASPLRSDRAELIAGLVAEPYAAIVAPFARVFSREPGPVGFFVALGLAAWMTIVWGLIGGAIARIAAVEGATGGRPGIVPALRFALGHAVGLIGAPLSPLIGIGFFAALCAGMGLLYRIPGATGSTIAGIFAFLPLLAGLVMALMAAGLALGWPLMIATVAVEAEDAFDALSRSYSYVLSRPGRYVLYAAIAGALGMAGWVAVWALASLTVHMAAWGLSFGGPSAEIGRLFTDAPTRDDAPGMLHAFWIDLVRLLAHGWLYAYFFTAATLVYRVLRREVDGAPLEDIGGLTPVGTDFVAPSEPSGPA